MLGQGGFGAVYRAWDLNLSTAVALKANLAEDGASKRQFEREAQILAKLKHPNLPRVTDHFVIPDEAQYLVMDFIEGENLEEVVVSRGRLPLPQVRDWAKQIGGALSYLHRQQPPVIHRDLKPSNVIITPDNQAMLVDFGLVKLFDEHSRTTRGARAITPGYSPPEQYGTGRTDQRADIFAFAGTLYFMLTGVDPQESVQRMVVDEVQPANALNPEVPGDIALALATGMAVMPTDRYDNVDDLLAAIDAAPASTPASPAFASTSNMPTIVDAAPYPAPPPPVSVTPPARPASEPRPVVSTAPPVAGPPPAVPKQTQNRSNLGFLVGAGAVVALLLVAGFLVGGGILGILLGGSNSPLAAVLPATDTPGPTSTVTPRPSNTPRPATATPRATATRTPVPLLTGDPRDWLPDESLLPAGLFLSNSFAADNQSIADQYDAPDPIREKLDGFGRIIGEIDDYLHEDGCDHYGIREVFVETINYETIGGAISHYYDVRDNNQAAIDEIIAAGGDEANRSGLNMQPESNLGSTNFEVIRFFNDTCEPPGRLIQYELFFQKYNGVALIYIAAVDGSETAASLNRVAVELAREIEARMDADVQR